jgi:hypothetical protein
MKCRYLYLSGLLLAILIASGCTVYSAGPPPGAPPPGPPAVVIAEPEYLYLMPSWGVYFVPGVSIDILYYNGLWYYNARGIWYWGHSYRGPWLNLRVERVPKVLRKLPPDYRSRYRHDQYRVPYGHWKKRWEAPPPQTKQKPPGFMYKVPKAGAYAYPDARNEMFFRKDRWYKRYQGVWYWSWSYNGPWAYINPEQVPKQVRNLPPQRYDQYEKVPWEKGRKKWGDNR